MPREGSNLEYQNQNLGCCLLHHGAPQQRALVGRALALLSLSLSGRKGESILHRDIYNRIVF